MEDSLDLCDDCLSKATNIQSIGVGCLSLGLKIQIIEAKQIDWEQRRYELAKEVLPLIIGDTVIDYLDVVEVDKGAVRLSDALIEELKKK